MAIKLWGVTIAILLYCRVLPSQTPDRASIQGFVADQSKAAITGAHLLIRDESTGAVRTAVSDSTGKFNVSGIPTQDAFTISTEKGGFAPASVHGVRFVPGSRADLSLILRVAGGASDITVRGNAGDLRIDQPQLGIDLSREQMEETPGPFGRMTYLPLLNAANKPAISQGDVFINQNLLNTNGAGRRQTWFEVDGANAIDMWGRQTIFSNIPILAVGEMTVLTNAYSSEYGGGTGSVVNLVTRSGGERFHAEVRELWRPATLGAGLSGFNSSNATSGNQIVTDAAAQTAVAVSGTLPWKSKTQFYGAGEWNREAKGSPVTSPIAPGVFVGRYRGWLSLLRLDQQLGANNKVFARSNADEFTDTNPNGTVGGSNLPTVARTFRRRTFEIEVADTAILGPNQVNDIRGQFQLASPITQFAPEVYGTQFSVPITSMCGVAACSSFTTGTSQDALLLNRQFEISELMSYTRGCSNWP